MLLHALAALQLAAAQVPADVPPPQPVYHGAQGQLEVPAPRLADEAQIDGALDEPAWARAALLTGFSQYAPVDGVPAEDSTEVLVWYSADAMHFGIRAYEPHGAVNARLADRDRIQTEDYVVLLLDTQDDGRRAYHLAVNPLGVQADGILSEGERTREGHFAAETRQSRLDLAPDFVFESRGRVTPWGFQVEVRIPFRSIRYQSVDEQRWGLHILRTVQHSGHEQSWAPARRGETSFLPQAGRLTALSGIRRGLALDVSPVLTARADGARASSGWTYDESGPELGANVRWGVTESLALNGTVNPDFSQVESDAGQLSYDPRQALFFPEKRPFFLEGSEQLQAPSNLVYTRRIVSPVAAAKLSGKVSGVEVGLLSAVDDDDAHASGESPIFNIVRLRRDVGDESTVGMLYTDRVEGSAWNRVAAADAHLVLGGDWALDLQGAASLTGEGEGHVASPLLRADFGKAGRRWGLTGAFRAIDEEFVAGAGFLSRTGYVQANVSPRVTVFGDAGDRIESWSGAVVLDATWDHDTFWRGRGIEDVKLHLNNSFALRGGWRLNGSVLIESFGYPAVLYTDYAVERAGPGGQRDTVAFTGGERIPNLDFVVSVHTPRWERLSGGVFALAGRDENFQEWAPAWIGILGVNVAWRPTRQIRVDGSWDSQHYLRPDDRSTVAWTQLPRVKLEYQVTRSIFVRAVGQYTASFRDALHDDTRTEDPILIRGADGVYRRALEERSNRFDGDVLFAYQPNPGTVVFAGYGARTREPTAFRFRDLERTGDGFFLKVSWLFRM